MKYAINARALLASLLVAAAGTAASAQYTQTVLVANDSIYHPTVLVDPFLQDGWGLTLRPPGAGGHFWISNFASGTTTTYIGDVRTPSGFMPLQQDSLKVVDIALGDGRRVDGRPVADPPMPTGQVYNYSTTDFVVSGEGVIGASKFIFVTAEGTISGWTEQTDNQGILHRQTVSVIKVDQSALFDDDRFRYTGCAITDYPSNNFLYVTNYIENVVEVYDHQWQRLALPSAAFTYPGEPQDYKPFNIQYFRSGPNGEGRLWVAYAQAGDPWEQEPNQGAVAEFDLQGNFIRRLVVSSDFDGLADSELKNPWGLVFAPANFGPMSGKLLVSNFGDGTIAAFDPATMRFVDYLRDDNGEPLIVDGIWGMVVGNGVRLGDSNAIYFAAGPNSEIDGTFGTIRLTSATCPVIAAQPAASVEACLGGEAHVSVSAPGPVAQTYRWEREVDSGIWQPLAAGMTPSVGVVSGEHTPALSISNARSTTHVRCVITTACGSVTSAASDILVTPCASNCDADLNADGNVDQGDVDYIIGVVAGGENPTNIDPDFNLDGNADQGDIDALLNVVAGGACP